MIFIFDWGHETFSEAGPLSINDIPLDLEGEMFWLAIRRKWFRAFFIPIVPTATDYVLIEDKTGMIIPVERSFYLKYKPLAELNQLVADGKISDEEYDRKRSDPAL
jgi:hypothetical protein